MRVVDQLRGGVRHVSELPKRSARGIKAGARGITSVPPRVGQAAGRAGRTVGRTVTGLPSRASELVRGGASEAAAAPRGNGASDGLIERARDNPRFAVTIAGGALLLLAWIAWAIYVTSAHGARAGLGVVLSWPVLLGALVLVSLPFIGVFLLVRRLNTGGHETGAVAGPGAEGEALEDEAEDSDEDEDSEEEGDSEDEASEGDEDGEDDEDEAEDDEDEAEDDEDEAEDDEDETEPEQSSKAGSKS